jgi:DNA modification methylase
MAYAKKKIINEKNSEKVETTQFGSQYAKDLSSYIPQELLNIDNPQTFIPKIARDKSITTKIDSLVKSIPTTHSLYRCDARSAEFIAPNSVHLILTSPPYWTLKDYNHHEGQLGHIEDYKQFLDELDKVWKNCYRILVPGGRLICVVGDVCLSRRKNKGRHTVVPLHASIQERCRELGFDNLAPIIWHKIANAVYEVEGAGGFLGKPYEPNAVVKNDIEFILMQRKSGGYRTPTLSERLLSVISEENYQKWFQQIWAGITGASTRQHPAPYPLELAERLIRMFSFVGDNIFDPFMGTGTTNLAAAKWGRCSMGIEIDPKYFSTAEQRLSQEASNLFKVMTVTTVDIAPNGGITK